MSVANPLVNGNRFSFASIELAIAGVLFYGVQEIEYDDSLTPGSVRGTSAQRLGRTLGDYEANASISIYQEEWADLQLLLAPTLQGVTGGLYTAIFDVTVTYAEVAFNPPQSDVLKGCRIKKAASSHKQGTDGLLKKLDLDVMYITQNGKTPFPTLIAG